jgi:hypothetical protein
MLVSNKSTSTKTSRVAAVSAIAPAAFTIGRGTRVTRGARGIVYERQGRIPLPTV